MKGLLILAVLIAILGAGALYFGIIGKVLAKIYTPKKEKKEIE